MPRASKVPINTTLGKELEDSFSDLIASLQKSSDIKLFFSEFLTREEKTMLFKRLMLHLMFEKGYDTREIQAALGIRYETIRVHRGYWEKSGDEYRLTLKKIASKKRTKELISKIDKIVDKLNLAINARNDMRARAKFISGD